MKNLLVHVLFCALVFSGKSVGAASTKAGNAEIASSCEVLCSEIRDEKNWNDDRPLLCSTEPCKSRLSFSAQSITGTQKYLPQKVQSTAITNRDPVLPISSSGDTGVTSGVSQAGAVVAVDNTTAQDGTAIAARRGAASTDRDLREVDALRDQLPPAARKSLGAAAEQLQKRAANPSLSAAETSDLKNDAQLVKEAGVAIKREMPFPESKAQQATDLVVRKNLEFISAVQSSQQKLEKESDRLTSQLGQLLQVASKASANAKGMGAVDKTEASKAEKASAKSSESGDLNIPSKSSEAAQMAAASKDPDGFAKSLLDMNDPDPSKAQLAAAKKALKGKLKASLREKLAAYIKAHDGAAGSKGSLAEAALASAQFEGHIPVGGPVRELVAIDESHHDSPFDFAASAMAQGSLNGSAFPMNHGETEAEIDRIVGEGRALAQMQSGILSADSSDLFSRVRSAHASCQKRKCVMP
jgi:hypothetical protein